MKNVSFGRMYTIKESSKCSMRQRDIEDLINEKFQAREERNGSNGTYPRTLDEMLEEDMFVDIYVKHKKNGDIELFLQDARPNDEFLKGIVKPKDKIKLTLNQNLPPLKIRKLLTEYTNKCRRLANFYFNEISKKAAEKFSDITDLPEETSFSEIGCAEN